MRDVVVTQIVFGAAICFTFMLFSKGQGFSALLGGLCVILPNLLLGLGFLLARVEGLIVLFSAIKIVLEATLLAMCFIFFVIAIEGFLAGMAATLLAPVFSSLLNRQRFS